MSARLLLTILSALFVGLVWHGDGLAQDKKGAGGKVDSKPAAASSTRSKSTGVSTKKKKIPSSGGGKASPGGAQKQAPSGGDRRTSQPDISAGSKTKESPPASTDKRKTEDTQKERGAPASKVGSLDDSLNERKKGAPVPKEEEAAGPGELDAPVEGGTVTTQAITPEELDEFIEANPDSQVQDYDGDGDYEAAQGLGEDAVVSIEDGYAYIDSDGDGSVDLVVPSENYDPETNAYYLPVDTDNLNLYDGGGFGLDYEAGGYVLEDRDGDGVPETYLAFDYDNDGVADLVLYGQEVDPEAFAALDNVEPSQNDNGGTDPDIPPGGWAAGYEDGDVLTVDENTVPTCTPNADSDIRWEIDPDATYEQVGDDIYVDNNGDNIADVILPGMHFTEDGYLAGGPPTSPPPTDVAEQDDRRPADLRSRLIVGAEVAAAPGQLAPPALDGLSLIGTLRELKSLYNKDLIQADQYDAMQLRALAALDPQVTGVEYGLQLLRDFWDQSLISADPYATKRTEYLDAL